MYLFSIFTQNIYNTSIFYISIYLDDYFLWQYVVHPSRDPENEERRIPDFFAVNLP